MLSLVEHEISFITSGPDLSRVYTVCCSVSKFLMHYCFVYREKSCMHKHFVENRNNNMFTHARFSLCFVQTIVNSRYLDFDYLE